MLVINAMGKYLIPVSELSLHLCVACKYFHYRFRMGAPCRACLNWYIPQTDEELSVAVFFRPMSYEQYLVRLLAEEFDSRFIMDL